MDRTGSGARLSRRRQVLEVGLMRERLDVPGGGDAMCRSAPLCAALAKRRKDIPGVVVDLCLEQDLLALGYRDDARELELVEEGRDEILSKEGRGSARRKLVRSRERLRTWKPGSWSKGYASKRAKRVSMSEKSTNQTDVG